MKCSKCLNEFEEKDLHESHDVPCYLFNGEDRKERKQQADKFGRRWLCVKCHDIYEKTLPFIIIYPLEENIKQCMRESAARFSKSYFKNKGEGNECNK